MKKKNKTDRLPNTLRPVCESKDKKFPVFKYLVSEHLDLHGH